MRPTSCLFSDESIAAPRGGTGDYLDAAGDAGFDDLQAHQFSGDEALATAVPAGRKYVGRPLLLVVEGRRAV